MTQTEKDALFASLRVPCGAKAFDDVPYETKVLRLEKYAELLLSWSEKMNLVAKSTLPNLWDRHFADSAQLLKYIPNKAQCFVDLGSGAGFPGLVLSALGAPEVHLIESVGKKAQFLAAVAKELDLNVTVHNERIESLRNLKADVITARALTALPKLLSYSKPFMDEKTVAIYLKGEKAPAELTAAKKYWTFKHKAEPSLTSDLGSILILSKLKVRASHGQRRKQPTY